MIELNDDSLITLTDENGEDMDFLLLDVIEYEGCDYMVLLPMTEAESEEEEEEDEVFILRADRTDDGEVYSSVDDQATVDAVFALFQQELATMEAEDADSSEE